MIELEKLKPFVGLECMILESRRARAVMVVDFKLTDKYCDAIIESVSPKGVTFTGEMENRSVAEWWDISRYQWHVGSRSDIRSSPQNVHCTGSEIVFAHPQMSHTELYFLPDLVKKIKQHDSTGWTEFFLERYERFFAEYEERQRLRQQHGDN